MATQCRGTKTKRINRHKLAVIQAYIIIGTLVLIGFIGGLVVGRATAPKKQVTVTETVEVPSYEADSLPVAEEVTYFDVPLSHSLQRYIYEVCADENVPVSLIIAMIDQESKFNPEVVSKTGDYGLMQINTINHEWLAEEYRTADMLDPYQNVFCGIKVIGSYIQNYNDYGLALMAYNMGERRRQKKAGIKVQKEPTLNLKVSDFDHMVSHAEKSAKERATAAAIHEIDRQILEHDEAYSLDIDAMVLWTLHVYLGFGKKRLERFYRDMLKEHIHMREVYEMDDTYPERYKLKELCNVDVEALNNEFKEIIHNV